MTRQSGDKISQVQKLKEQGNDCVRQQKYTEAMLHYTHAIELDAENYSLYSNRSYALLKMQQYHFAMMDALTTIHLKPDWIKGYYRKAEIEFHTFRFNEALQSYGQALHIQPNDPDIIEAINKASRSLIKDQKADQQIPWLGAGIGLILGVIVVIADYVFTNKPTVTHPLLMAFLTISIAMVGFAIAKGFRYFVKCQRKSLLEPPMDFNNDNTISNGKTHVNNTEKINNHDNHSKYTKAHARQRFQKGKT